MTNQKNITSSATDSKNRVLERGTLTLKQETTHAEDFYGLAMLAQQRGDDGATERFLLESLRAQPDSVQSWFSLGNFYQRKSQFLEATEAYWQAVSLCPDSAPIFNNLGYTLQQLKRWDEAILCYQRALNLQPHSPEIEVNLGNALNSLGQLNHEQQTQLANVNYQLGLQRVQKGDSKAAQLYFEQVVALLPSFADAHAHLGMVLVQLKEFEKATLCCQAALRLRSQHQLAQSCLGQIKKQKHQIQQNNSDELSELSEPGFDETFSHEPHIAVKSDIEILQKVSGALINWAKSGFATVDETIYQKRYDSCMRCPNLADAPPKVLYRLITANKSNEKICQLCGCVISKKARIASETCPDPHPNYPALNRWEENLKQ